MVTHSSVFAWRIPWTEEPTGLQSMRLQRVGHDLMTNTLKYTHISHLNMKQTQIHKVTVQI